jgi:hypothetical protein
LAAVADYDREEDALYHQIKYRENHKNKPKMSIGNGIDEAGATGFIIKV